jgi:hypothetical protein
LRPVLKIGAADEYSLQKWAKKDEVIFFCGDKNAEITPLFAT